MTTYLFYCILVVMQNKDKQIDFDNTIDTNEFEDINLNSKTTKNTSIGDYKIAYEAYKNDPNPKTLSAVVNDLSNTINYALASNNALGNPVVSSQAKLITAKAIKNYNPNYNVTLPTYVTSQLQKLTRISREASQPIKIPERFIYESQALKSAEEELYNKNLREPTISELTDVTGFSAAKIAKIRSKSQLKQLSEGNFYTSADNDSDNVKEDASAEAGDRANFSNEAMAYVYNDLDYKSKKIFEHITGYGGAKILDFNDIADKLNLSLSQVYRISKKLADKYAETLDSLNLTYSSN